MVSDCRVERRPKQSRLELTWDNIGLNRQHAKFRSGNQSHHCKAIGRHCSEDERFDGFRIHHSITLSVPDMSSWPSPQKTSQKNVNVPALSGTNLSFSTTPGLISARRRNSGSLNP